MRYVTRPRASYYDAQDEWCPAPQGMTVFEVGEDIEPTGLIDSRGRDICRCKDAPGFVRF